MAMQAASSDVSMNRQEREQVEKVLKPQIVRIVVLGDEKVGKTSLICTLVSRHFTEKVPALLLTVQIPAEESNENVVLSITDTSTRQSDHMRVISAAKTSDAILLVYDLSRPETFQRIRKWLDLIDKHRNLPVVLVANKSDLNDFAMTRDGTYDNQKSSILSRFPFIVDVVECSTKNFAQVAKAFHLAQKAVLYPVEPLYNAKKDQLQPKFLKAIKRTFRLYNQRHDGLLTREELNAYHYDCFGISLARHEMDTLFDVLSDIRPDIVSEDSRAITVEGFTYLFHLFVLKGRPESCWQVLRYLGYNHQLELEIPRERITVAICEPDQSVELTEEALAFLCELFKQFDQNKDGVLEKHEMDDVFSICKHTKAPWAVSDVMYERKANGAISFDSWCACWSYQALENPEITLEYLFYLGFNDRESPAIQFTDRRSTTRTHRSLNRLLLRCIVFDAYAPTEKSRLFHRFVRDNNDDDPLPSDAVAVNVIKGRHLVLSQSEDGDACWDQIQNQADAVCIVCNPQDKESGDRMMELRESAVKLMKQIVTVEIHPKSIVQETGSPASPAPDSELSSTSGVVAGKSNTADVVCLEDEDFERIYEKLVERASNPAQTSSSGFSVLQVAGFGAIATMVAVTVVILSKLKPKAT